MTSRRFPRRPSRFLSWTLHVMALLALLSSSALRATSSDAQAVLDSYKHASGGASWDDISILSATGSLRTSGLAGTIESWEELASGRYVTRYDLGIAQGAEGFDGKTPWQQDPSGLVTATDSEGDVQAAHNQAFLAARGYWYPERWPAEIRYLRKEDEGARSFHVLEIEPEGGRALELWIDDATQLLDRIIEKGAVETTTTTFSDYRQIAGVSMPFAIHSGNGDAAYDTWIELKTIKSHATAPESRFETPVVEIDDFEILRGSDSVTIPFKLHNNHIYVMASVNGTPDRLFLVDTGGMNVLTEAAAAELGVTSEGAVQVRGVGEGHDEVGFTKVESIQVGGIRLFRQIFIVLSMNEIAAAEGLEFSGLVGFELFRRFVVEIDYAGRQLTLTRPEAYRHRDGGKKIPFRFDNRTPVVEGSIDGIPGSFTLDTGSRSALSIHGPFANEHDFEKRYKPPFERLSGWGVGGAVRAKPIGRVTLKLGHLEIPNVSAEISQQEEGAFTDRYTAGNIGGTVLERFTVTFDYGAQVVLLEPNESFDSPDDNDRSGLWLNLTPQGLRVEDVVPGSPAETAGLEVGDLILAVDGQPFTSLSLSALRERFRVDPIGTEIDLEVASEEVRQKKRLVLRDLL